MARSILLLSIITIYHFWASSPIEESGWRVRLSCLKKCSGYVTTPQHSFEYNSFQVIISADDSWKANLSIHVYKPVSPAGQF